MRNSILQFRKTFLRFMVTCVVACGFAMPSITQAYTSGLSFQDMTHDTAYDMSYDAAVEARSDNFVLFGQSNQTDARATLENLEVFRSALLDIHNHSNRVLDETIKIFLVGDTHIYDAVSPGHGTSAYYFDSFAGPIIVVNMQEFKQDSSGFMSALFHEYTHHFLSRHLGYSIPVWLNEGLAEYYSTFEMGAGGDYEVGHIKGEYINALEQSTWTPAVKILNALHDYPSGQSPFQAQASLHNQAYFYAQSWLMAHYFTKDNIRRQNIKSFVKQLSPLNDTEAVLKSTYGLTYDNFEMTLRDYMQSFDMSERTIPATRRHKPSYINVVDLSPDIFRSHLYYLVSVAPRVVSDEGLRRHLRRDIKPSHTSDLVMNIADALSNVKSQNYERASAHAEAAMKLAPDHSDVKFVSAFTGFFSWDGHVSPAPKPLRQRLRRAIDANPAKHTLRLMLLNTYAADRRTLPGEARAIVEFLSQSGIERINPQGTLAFVPYLAELDRHSDAISMLEMMRVWSKDAGVRAKSGALLLEFKYRRRR